MKNDGVYAGQSKISRAAAGSRVLVLIGRSSLSLIRVKYASFSAQKHLVGRRKTCPPYSMV